METACHSAQKWNDMNISETCTTCRYVTPQILVYEECAARVDK